MGRNNEVRANGRWHWLENESVRKGKETRTTKHFLTWIPFSPNLNYCNANALAKFQSLPKGIMGRDPSSATVEVQVHPRRDTIAGCGRRLSPSPPSPPAVRDRDFSLFKRWFPWLVPTFVVANIVVFIVTMYINDCPKHSFYGSCVASFLGRFSFQPLKENPLFGPSSSTWVLLLSSPKSTILFSLRL